jgi:hypothetical protein
VLTIARAGAARRSADRAIASNPDIRRLVVVMLETLGQRVCRMIVKNLRPTLDIGRPLSVVTGGTAPAIQAVRTSLGLVKKRSASPYN